MRFRGSIVLVVALGACLAGLRGTRAGAQRVPQDTGQSPPASELRSVEGRVVRGTTAGERPVDGQFVVLHRIAPDGAGPVDSARTTRDGRYRFSYRAGPGEALYIVSTRYAGIAYFTPPLRERAVRSPDGDVTVFDTTSAEIPLTVRGRHFVVSPPDAEGTRHVVDVFEIANESMLTRTAGDAPQGTWATRIPEGARNASVGQGDISPGAVRFDQGRATVFAPFPPGVKQVAFTYELPPGQRSISLVLDQPAAMLELLVEGSGATASGVVARQEPVALEGRQFERFLGQQVPAGASVRLELPRSPGGFGTLRTALLFLLGGIGLTLGIRFGRRGGAAAGVASSAPDLATRPTSFAVDPDDPDTLAQAIAALDAVHDRQGAAGDAAQGAYQSRRAELMSRLIAALARTPVEAEVDTPAGSR